MLYVLQTKNVLFRFFSFGAFFSFFFRRFFSFYINSSSSSSISNNFIIIIIISFSLTNSENNKSITCL